ncbi:hypothetical protein [Streptomyces sp. NPDC047974]|uniref:thiolase family protein n=1 Tax=Streptomyces sp. NPDC047974 TaxID=3154343 RepID=UPI003407C993
MSESVIVAGARTPLSGLLATLGAPSPAELGMVAIREALGRTGIDGGDVDRVVVGHGPTADAGWGLTRRAALRAGVAPDAAPPSADDVARALGLGAIALADELVRSGKHRVVVAVGLEYLPARPRTAVPPDGTQPPAALFPRDLVEFSGKEAYAALASRAGFGHGVGGPGRARTGTALRGVSGPGGPVTPFARSRPSAVPAPARPRMTGRVPNGASALIVMRKASARALGIDWLAEIAAYATASPADGEPGARPAAPSPVRALTRALACAGVAPAGLALTEADPTLPTQARASLRRLGGGPHPVGSPADGSTPGLPPGASGPRIALHLAQALNRREGGLGGVVMCAPEGHGEALLIRAAPQERRAL